MAKVPPSELRPACDPSVFKFETTADVAPHTGLIGQDRAVAAIQFGLSIESRGFNICVTGEAGTGRTTAVREYLESFSQTKAPPDEWCYVNNFVDPHRPLAIKLPPGKGREFKNAMAATVEEAKRRIARAFESDDFVNRRDEIVSSVQHHHETVFTQLAEQARQESFLLQGDPSGFFLVPLANGQPMADQAFGELPPEQRDAILKRREQLMEQLRAVLKEEQGFEGAAQQRLMELQRTIAATAVHAAIDGLFDAYAPFPAVIEYLAQARQDMISHIEDFLRRPDAPGIQGQPPMPMGPMISPLRKYEVNLLVDCADEHCATVVFESNPTPQRLFGRIEKEAVFGAVTTDFTMVRPGSIHHANGGYLVVDFDELLLYPLSWNELKRTIRTGHLTIEEMGERMGFIETKTVRPEPIPWTGKIVAIAREEIYRILYAADPDFREMFKVKADFDMHIDRTVEHEQAYAGLISSVTKKEGLLPLDRSGVARIVDEGTRMAADHNKLSIRFGDITDIVRESSYWAHLVGATVVSSEHVRRAIDERVRRVNLVEEHVRESVKTGVMVIDTAGEEVGQVNGLSVVDLGDTSFGQPSRITATIGVGREGVIDLQRESHLSGPIFSKAILTLQGFLVDRYATETPLTIAARIAFEQSYGVVEGDSATCAETCALLSRIAGVPLKQSLAITGSMDQRGEVQAIGGANEKIEGFFDVCSSRGLTGMQGVIIPATNVQHLMLREDVVQAVKDGKFTIHSATTIDEALEILSGIEAGSKREDGSYAPESFNGRVFAALKALAERLREFGEDKEQGNGRRPAHRPDEDFQA